MDIGSLANEALNAYQSFMAVHPHIGNMATAEVTFFAGDAISQLITDKKINPKKLGYTAILAPIYGLGLEGLMESGELVGDYISEEPFAKSALGPNLWGNVMNAFFFVNNTVGEETGYSIRGLGRHYKDILFGDGKDKKSFWERMKEKYFGKIELSEYNKSVLSTLTAWNAIQTWNYSTVPEELRTPICLAAGVVWLTALSLWSLKGGRKLTYGTEEVLESKILPDNNPE